MLGYKRDRRIENAAILSSSSDKEIHSGAQKSRPSPSRGGHKVQTGDRTASPDSDSLAAWDNLVNPGPSAESSLSCPCACDFAYRRSDRRLIPPRDTSMRRNVSRWHARYSDDSIRITERRGEREDEGKWGYIYKCAFGQLH